MHYGGSWLPLTLRGSAAGCCLVPEGGRLLEVLTWSIHGSWRTGIAWLLLQDLQNTQWSSKVARGPNTKLRAGSQLCGVCLKAVMLLKQWSLCFSSMPSGFMPSSFSLPLYIYLIYLFTFKKDGKGCSGSCGKMWRLAMPPHPPWHVSFSVPWAAWWCITCIYRSKWCNPELHWLNYTFVAYEIGLSLIWDKILLFLISKSLEGLKGTYKWVQ